MLRESVPMIETALRKVAGRVSVACSCGSESYLHNADEVFPSASLIKLPVLMAVLDAVRLGRMSLAQEFRPPATPVGGCGVVEFFSPDSRLKLQDLLLCMIAISDNAATNAVLDAFGVEAVNSYLGGLGLSQTVLRRRMMDQEARLAGRENTTTPAEMAFLLNQLLRPTVVDPWVAEKSLSYLERQQLPQGIGNYLPEGLVAHKTGELEGLFHDVGIIEPRGPEPLVYAFLSARMESTGDGQWLAAHLGRILYAKWRRV